MDYVYYWIDEFRIELEGILFRDLNVKRVNKIGGTFLFLTHTFLTKHSEIYENVYDKKHTPNIYTN